MRARCTNPKNKSFKNYGGRGVSVHPAWADDFERFLADMGERPEDASLDRIDNSGNYEPGNCRWADRLTQARNRRSVRLFERGGEALTIGQMAERLGVKRASLFRRVRLGESPEDAALAIRENIRR